MAGVPCNAAWGPSGPPARTDRGDFMEQRLRFWSHMVYLFKARRLLDQLSDGIKFPVHV